MCFGNSTDILVLCAHLVSLITPGLCFLCMCMIASKYYGAYILRLVMA